jgi:soluble lytic murein transglycosylase
LPGRAVFALNASVRWNRLTAGLLLVLCIGSGSIGCWWWQRGRLERSQDGPIRAAAQRYGVEPALVKAIVWRESRFNPAARGGSQEIGLMQLREEAAQEWADAEQIYSFEHEHCVDPRTNTLAGTFYLSKLLRRYAGTDNPMAYALADYNAGRANVLKWNGGQGATNSAVFVEQIGFPGTREYVKSVMQRYQRYRPPIPLAMLRRPQSRE